MKWKDMASHPWLKEISNPPSELYFQGSVESLSAPCIAIVGSRNPSHYGIRSALYFAKKLASFGFTIVSGLARGIDSFAHQGTLLANGKTVAVLGNGFNRLYPPENRPLAQAILNLGGCLLSEYAPDEPPLKHHFPERNRIISGLSVGTLIIEAAEKSGSLITARLAMEQNRDLFVVPSHFNDQKFIGGHLLVQEGAKLVLNVEDILSEIPGFTTSIEINQAIESFDEGALKKVFDSWGGIVSLSQIYSTPKGRRDWLKDEMQKAIERKKVVEALPQMYFWVD
jgi:DNA processing protein